MLETEIIKLREAIEALTALVNAGGIIQSPKNENSPEQKTVEKQDENAAIAAQNENSSDAVTPKQAHQATLALVRRDMGKRDAVKAKLAEFNANKISDLSNADLVVYFEWVKAQ